MKAVKRGTQCAIMEKGLRQVYALQNSRPNPMFGRNEGKTEA